MIEQSVSLASNGVVKVPGYEQMVRFGYTKNRGVYRLHVDATGEWEGLTIRTFWHVPDGKDPASSLVVDGYVAVPASVTAQPGSGCVTFEGSDGAKVMTSADLRYRVSANSGTEDGTEPEPGTPAWQQLVDAVHTDATAAEQAKTDAQTAAQQAGASAQKAGQALSDTITAKEDALKAIGDKQTAATQAVDTVRDKALQQVEASTEAAQTAASEAATSAGNADQSAQAAAGSLQELKDGIAAGDFKGEQGPQGPIGPVGPQGEQGPQGPKGETGPAVALDTTLTHEGEAADAKVTGDALATKAVIDDTTVGTDAWSSKHIVDMLCPPISETGNPVVCYPVAKYPWGCKVSWEPTQEGSGEPSPDNIRPISGRDAVNFEQRGANMLHITPFKSTIKKGITFEYVDGGGIHVSGTSTGSADSPYFLVGLFPPGKYYGSEFEAKIYPSISVTQENGRNWISTRGAFEIPSGNAVEYWRITIAAGITIDATFYPYIVAGSTDPNAYPPYVSTAISLTLPQTIYGGEVDVQTGGGLETWKLVTLDGTEKWETWGVNENNAAVTGFYNYSINDYDPNGNKLLCSAMPYKNVDVWGGRNEGIGYSNALNQGSRYMIYSVKTDTLSDTSDNASAVASFKSYLAAKYAAGTPVQIAYKLEEPVPVTATGAQPIPALNGVNTLLTDADSVTVTGRADPIKRITDLEDAVASMT